MLSIPLGHRGSHGAMNTVDKEWECNGTTVDELSGHIHYILEGFLDKFFKEASWMRQAEWLAEKTGQVILDTRLKKCSFRETHRALIDWLQRLQPGNNAQFRTPGPRDSDSQTETSVLLQSPCASSGQVWSNVRVVGQFCDDRKCYHDGFSTMVMHTVKVFTSQPTRLFLHGFYIVEDTLEIWFFNRSGLYTCTPLDLTNTRRECLTILISYTLMNDSEVGMSSLFKQDDIGLYLLCQEFSGDTQQKLYLDPAPIFSHQSQALVSDGLTCYRAKKPDSDWGYAVKIKWRLAGSGCEPFLLNLAREKNIEGVAHGFSHEDLVNTDDLIRGLKVVPPPSTAQSLHSLRSSTRKPTTGVSKSRDDQALDYSRTPNPRILSYVVTAPLGRPLHQYDSVIHLLEVLRDAIRGHRSLYQNGGILHQDISHGNILISTSLEPGAMKGVLIDLDIAREVASKPIHEHEMVGTQPFLAIRVLRSYLPDSAHTYRHDLESFLYVFCYMAICTSPGVLPNSSRINSWTVGKPFEMAAKKAFDMERDNFGAILNEFRDDFVALYGFAESLRGVLFPIRNGDIWTGTDLTVEGTNALYDDIINTFDEEVEINHRLELGIKALDQRSYRMSHSL